MVHILSQMSPINTLPPNILMLSFSSFPKLSRPFTFSNQNYYCCSCRWGETMSDLRPPKGILFVPQMAGLYEYGEPRRNDTDKEKPKNSEKSPVPVPLCPSQIPYGLTQVRTRYLLGERPATNRMSRGTGSQTKKFYVFTIYSVHVTRGTRLIL
jgi:hypothetical protein